MGCSIKISLILCWLLILPVPMVHSAPVRIVTHQYYPYQYEEEGQLKGFVAAIVAEAFKRMGQPVSIKLYPFARAHTMVKNGDADGIFTVAKTAERETFADFPSEVLIWQTMALFVKADSPLGFDGDFNKLRDHRVGVIYKYRYGKVFDDVVDKGTLANVRPANSAESNVRMLVAGRIDYWVSNRELAAFVLNKLRLTEAVRELQPAVQTLPTYLMFSKKRDSAALCRRFGEEVRKMRADGSYDKIVTGYWRIQMQPHEVR
jgi:polar amino acid transport system substrate-binding protein